MMNDLTATKSRSDHHGIRVTVNFRADQAGHDTQRNIVGAGQSWQRPRRDRAAIFRSSLSLTVPVDQSALAAHGRRVGGAP